MIKDLPIRLRDLRIKYGYSQKEVSEKIGVSPSIVSGYESGERTPSTQVLLSLAYLYGCSTDYLLGKQNDSSQLVLDVSGLSDKQINAIKNIAEVMKEK